MDFYPYLTEYQKDAKAGKAVSACVLAGCTACYMASQNEKEKEALLNFLKQVSAADLCPDGQKKNFLTPGKTYFFLCDNTGEVQYKEAIDMCMKWLKDCSRTPEGIFGCGEDASRRMSWEVMCHVYPFYMEYETRYHNKADYLDIVRQLRYLQPPVDRWTPETGWYLMTVITVMDSMSKEIFEHYKSLEEIFKKTIRSILDAGWDKSFDKKESAMMGYSIVKACNMGVLNSEKYAEVGLSTIDGVIDGPFDPKDSEMVGIAMMAYAEHLILNLN